MSTRLRLNGWPGRALLNNSDWFVNNCYNVLFISNYNLKKKNGKPDSQIKTARLTGSLQSGFCV